MNRQAALAMSDLDLALKLKPDFPMAPRLRSPAACGGWPADRLAQKTQAAPAVAETPAFTTNCCSVKLVLPAG